MYKAFWEPQSSAILFPAALIIVPSTDITYLRSDLASKQKGCLDSVKTNISDKYQSGRLVLLLDLHIIKQASLFLQQTRENTSNSPFSSNPRDELIGGDSVKNLTTDLNSEFIFAVQNRKIVLE